MQTNPINCDHEEFDDDSVVNDCIFSNLNECFTRYSSNVHRIKPNVMANTEMILNEGYRWPIMIIPRSIFAIKLDCEITKRTGK